MDRSEYKTFTVAMVTCMALVLFTATLWNAIFYSPEIEIDAKMARANFVSTSTSAIVSLPDRLLIPAINVDAHVQHVGINAKGNMASPNNFTDVGWYKYGTIPGNDGSAVIDGHVDNGLSLSGVFKRLSELAVGDEITVVTKSGERLVFEVESSEMYDYKHAPADLIFNEKGKARLRLVTCTGDWVAGDKTYDTRLVVTATRKI